MKSSPTYLPLDCKNAGDQMPLLTHLPSAAEKVWRIMVTKNSEIRLLVHCNDVKVVDTLISELTCKTAKFENWSKEVKKIKFHIYDTASDFYSSSPPLSQPITPGISLRICFSYFLNLNPFLTYFYPDSPPTNILPHPNPSPYPVSISYLSLPS